eukprot:377694-Rhodomonas_salina.2
MGMVLPALLKSAFLALNLLSVDPAGAKSNAINRIPGANCTEIRSANANSNAIIRVAGTKRAETMRLRRYFRSSGPPYARPTRCPVLT